MTTEAGAGAGWLAALPMYDLPELRRATDAWWAGLARHLSAAGVAEVPASLTRPARLEQAWDSPRLLFGQGCGYPLTHAYRGRWRVIASPTYDAEGCGAGTYRSRILVRADAEARGLADLVGARAAVNAPDSHSGHIALRAAMADHAPAGRPAFRDAVLTGGHVDSMAAVARGEADLCAVDCVTHALLTRHAPERVAGLRTLAWSASAPSLPFIAGTSVDGATLARLRQGLVAALADPDLADARAALLLRDAERPGPDAYAAIPRLARFGADVAFL